MIKLKPDTLRELFTTFFKIGSVSFGGGYAMLPMLERELSEKRNWVTTEELMDYYAIGQSTPGIIAINTATFTGYKQAGIPGGIAATLGMVCPSLIIIILIGSFLKHFEELVLVQKALEGVNIAVAVLLLNALWTFAKRTVKSPWSALLCLGAFVLVTFCHLSPILIVLLAGLAGGVSLPLGRRKK